MAIPSVVSSNPANGAVDVYLNVPLYVTFSTPGLLESSITVNSCILYNIATDSSVAVDLSYNSSTRVLTITPLSTLAEDTVYKIRFPGTDVAISPSYVIVDAGGVDVLDVTIDLTFSTGRRTNAVDLTLQGDLSLPSNVNVLGPFSVLSTFPKNHAADVPLDLDGSNRAYIKFSQNLSGSDMSTWLDTSIYPILDQDQYLAQSGVFGVGTLPSMTGLSYSGQYLYINFDGPMPNNAGVTVRLSEDIAGEDGTTFGPNSYLFAFTTERYPKIAGINAIKTELSSIADSLNDDYIASILLRNTVRLIFRWAPFNPDSPQWLAYKFIVKRTVVDILDDKDLEKALMAGVRRTLGDMTIAVDAMLGAAMLKMRRAEKEADDADRGMQGVKFLGARINQSICVNYRPDRLWHGINGRIYDFRFKYYQPDIPASNLDLTRQSSNQNWII